MGKFMSIASTSLLQLSRTRRMERMLPLQNSAFCMIPSWGASKTRVDSSCYDFSSNPEIQKRRFSFYGDSSNSSSNRNRDSTNTNSRLSGPSYQIYGEETALTVRAIPPEFRALASGTVVMNSTNRGRLLLQWNPRGPDGKYQWDTSIRFALTAEESASIFMARLDPQKLLLLQQQQETNEENGAATTVAFAEIVRQTSPNNSEGDGEEGYFGNDTYLKVFRARLQRDGSVELMVDIERDGLGGQVSLGSNEARGPLKIDLMVGEFYVLRSIVEHSLPRLIGWSTMLDASIEQSIQKANGANAMNYNRTSSPHNYQEGSSGGAPF